MALQRIDDTARESQAVFRAVMTAMAYPGRIQSIRISANSVEWPKGMAAIASTLCDFETPVWLGPELTRSPDAVHWLRFQTGAPIVREPGRALFAFSSIQNIPALTTFQIGTDEYPDRSTTLVLAVDELADGPGWNLSGPGIQDSANLSVTPLHGEFVAARAALQNSFPRGIDIIFVCGDRLAALPRTTIIRN